MKIEIAIICNHFWTYHSPTFSYRLHVKSLISL